MATQDTVILIRSAIRALLRIVDEKLGVELRSCCKRDDDYIAPGKPSCDWDDVQAREALVDALARDAYAILAALDGRMLASEVMQAVHPKMNPVKASRAKLAIATRWSWHRSYA